ncbi:ABC transporter ATP-binding protein [Mycoplasmatota bacterium]|nr:ABC transporter ATP-binding protein [Mycoplasmatota bacterium]
MIFGKTLNKYYIRFFHFFLIGITALILIDFFQLKIPEVVRGVIDGLTEGTMTKELIVDSVKMLFTYALIIVVGRFIWRYFILGASRRIEFGVRNEMFKHCEKLDQEFYQKNKTGGLMAYFINDLEAVRMSIGFGTIMVVDAAFLGSLAFYKMIRIDVKMTLIAVSPLILLAIIAGFLSRLLHKRFRLRQEAFEQMSDFVNENMSGIQVIKAFAREPKEIIEFLKANENNRSKTFSFMKLVVVVEIMMRFFITVIVIIILAYGGNLIKNTIGTASEFTIGMLFEYISYFMAMIWPMIAVVRVIQINSSGKASLERINNILNEDVKVKDEEVVDVEEIRGDIQFKNLTFSYPGSEVKQLVNVSFEIKKGETVGIIGRTGCGKTTLVDLLMRVYNIQSNSLFIDGIDIMRLPIRELRRSIGYVPQDGFLFSDNLYNNIALGIDRNGDYFDKVIKAAILSDVNKNIQEFKEGYETVIGERGVTLSGGQKQRVAIARALIKDPSILILDDSVSAVDTKTEETILENLGNVRSGKTTIVIAHRISSIKNADKIILMDEGKVLDVGTHMELISRCELYLDIVNRQKLEDEIEGL